MTRTIKASEVQPGMTIRWTHSGLTQECTVGNIIKRYSYGAVDIATPEGTTAYVGCSHPVTVLAEPQPEEPTALGARVVVKHEATGLTLPLNRGAGSASAWQDNLGNWRNWAEICDLGQVTIIDADPSWAVPETPVVPERIEEWPEDDKHLREYRWESSDGDVWTYNAPCDEWVCIHRCPAGWPLRGPWTRVADA